MRRILAGLFVVYPLIWVLDHSGGAQTTGSSAVRVIEPNTNDAVVELVGRVVGPNFESSLEMKENADFLLTPAFLVQEAISDDVIITYPSE